MRRCVGANRYPFPKSDTVFQAKVLSAVVPANRREVLLGQYTAANGKPGYLDDDTVPVGSTCPTFAAVALYIENPRWEGVPFIMTAGKGLTLVHKLYTHLLILLKLRHV